MIPQMHTDKKGVLATGLPQDKSTICLQTPTAFVRILRTSIKDACWQLQGSCPDFKKLNKKYYILIQSNPGNPEAKNILILRLRKELLATNKQVVE